MSQYCRFRVRIYCEDCGEYKRITQTGIDETWKPDGCAAHTTRDFVVEEECDCHYFDENFIFTDYEATVRTANSESVDQNGSNLNLFSANGYDSGAVARNGGSVFLSGGSNINNGTDGNVILAHQNTSSGVGLVGVRTNSPTCAVDIDSDKLRLRDSKTPAGATASGNKGDWIWDEDYFYVCVDTNTWKRAGLSSW